MPHSAPKLLFVSATLALGVGCATKIDRFTLDKLVDRATDVPDTGKVCALGESLAHPLISLSQNQPHKAMIIAEAVAALCMEQEAWDAELDVARARANLGELGPALAAEITDASIRAERAHAQAATRFERSFAQHEQVWGELGTGECPRIKEQDEFAYLFGLVTGTLALIHDRKGGGVNDVPLDRLLAVARAAECLDSTEWWSVPDALQAGAWATIPGSGPEGLDAWAELDRVATVGETSGVRVARAIQVMIAANAGNDAAVEAGLRAYAASLEQTPQQGDWALLDAYGTEVALHESDLLWTAQTGHRTPELGTLPADEADEAIDDPFGEGNPFGGGDANPFGSPEPSDDEATDDEATDDEATDEPDESPDESDETEEDAAPGDPTDVEETP